MSDDIFQFMIEQARTLMTVLVNNIISLNRRFNRGICTEYDGIVRKITAQSETTEELVKQTEYLDNLPVSELLKLKVSFSIKSPYFDIK